MRSKRLVFVLIIGGIIILGWIMTIQAVTGSKVIKAQTELVTVADGYMDKELYVRAIPYYEEALKSDTKMSLEIQEKLLTAYQSYGDIDSYISLVEARVASGVAKEEEYLDAADYYIAGADLGDAMGLIKQGIEKLDSDKLRKYYEEHRYVYSTSSTACVEVFPTTTNSRMLAFDGSKWGYIGSDGRTILDFVYDSATNFNDYGYAVVKTKGTYYTILENGDRYGVDDGINYAKMTDVAAVCGTRVLGQRDGSYSYFNYDFEPLTNGHQYEQITSNACGVAAVKKDGKWGVITDSGELVVDFVLEDVAINSLGCVFANNRAMVKENDRWHLIDVEGNRIGTEEYADAKAPESAGYIAVANAAGKWGYIDAQGNGVIDYQYTDAKSFSNHLGAVQTVNDWGYISEKNVVVIENIFADALPFHNGIAQAKINENVMLIKLKYFEE